MSSESKQIGVIGASHIFTGPIINDLCHTPQLRGSKVLIYDINLDRAQNNVNVCRRLAQELGAELSFEAVPDLQSVVVGSDFILNAALAGGRERGDKVKQAVAKETGIYGPIEAHAPYGQLRLMLDIAQQIERLNPNATLIQCANPIPEGLTLIAKETGVKFIGVCHGYSEWEHMARVLGMNPDLASVKIAGINHDVWLLEFLYQNKDAYPRLKEWIDTVSDQWYNQFLPYAKNVDYQLTPVAADLYRRFGVFPIGDTTRASTPDLAKYGYHDSPKIEGKWFGKEQGFESARGEANSRQWRAENIHSIDEAARNNKSVSSLFPNKPSGWQIVPIMTSIATGQGSQQMVNIKNNGAINKLDPELVVEIPAWVNEKGAHSQGAITLPPKVLNEALLARQDQAFAHVNAFRLGNKALLVEQVMRNHKVQGSRDTAEKIVDIWMAHDKDMAEHYK